ncbi:MAG: sigma-70 family RNA polymerase sigma factor [Phycisphaerales bacterium]|nr:sigma-70 family RNA polymerase sigma factor [Phycisphaerales bacterium]
MQDGPAPTDEQLLARYRAGDQHAFGLLASRHERRLLGLARGMLSGNTELAMEAVQETWMRVIRHASKYDGRASVGTWFYRICMNCARDIRRKHGRRIEWRLVDPHDSPRDDVPLDDLRRAVDALPDMQREIVLLCFHEGMSHAQVAELLGIPTGTVKSRLHSAMKRLRTMFAEIEA